MITRIAAKQVKEQQLSESFKAIAIVSPRQSGTSLYPIEIKSGKTVTSDYFKNFDFWNKITGTTEGTVIYGGDQVQKRSNGITVLPWNDINTL